MVVVRSDWGNDLVAFLPPDAPLDPAIPVTFTQIIARHERHMLMIFNADRNQWEVPGGGIEPGETLDDCAAREFMEEASQVADTLTLRGYALFQMHTRGGTYQYSAVYAATVSQMRPFVPSEECTQLVLWDGSEMLGGGVGTWSRAIIDHFGR